MRAIDCIIGGGASVTIALLFICFRIRIEYAIRGALKFRGTDIYLLLIVLVLIVPSVYLVVERISRWLHFGTRYRLIQLFALIAITAVFFACMSNPDFFSFPPWSIDRTFELAVICGVFSVPSAIGLLFFYGVRSCLFGRAKRK